MLVRPGQSASSLSSQPLDDLLVGVVGWRLPALNFTWFPPYGDLNQFNRPCPTCHARAHAAMASQPPRTSRMPCQVSDFCEDQPLPSQIDLATVPGIDADVLVFNFGLHYHDPHAYRRAVRAALRALDDFAARPGRAAVFRETSAQHFPVASGDYDEAIRRDPMLVRSSANLTDEDMQTVKVRQRWSGPSMCQALMGQHANATNVQHRSWRNGVLHDLYRELAPRHVHLQAFEDLTAERWDYHASTKWSESYRMWISDCTHFCFSPRFWDLSFHSLYKALIGGRQWLQHRHRSAKHLHQRPRSALPAQ